MFETKDSGTREVFVTGSQRDSRTGKGRFDLVPFHPLQRLAQLYERGAIKYQPGNWKKGQPLSRYQDSAARHLYQLIDGDKSEDHAAAVAWNMFAFMWTAEAIRTGKLPAELDDIGWNDDIG